MGRRILLFLLIGSLCVVNVGAESIKWVDFSVSEASLRYAMDQDIATFEQEPHLGWIDILAVAACRTGGKCPLASVKKAAAELKSGKGPTELPGVSEKLFSYYHAAYDALLGGLLGSYAIEINGEWRPAYGLKAFSPIAAGYGYSHCDDFGVGRSYGFRRKHLGNDLMGGLGTPIIAVESGVVEALGWNQYGGWRVGIRSADSRRYYYYAHLQKGRPFPEGLKEGDLVQAGDVIGFMGRTGYSATPDTNNIETVHLHFGIQLVFEEWQKECSSEIWVNAYPIVRLLSGHRSTVVKGENGWERLYPYQDLDIPENFGTNS